MDAISFQAGLCFPSVASALAAWLGPWASLPSLRRSPQGFGMGTPSLAKKLGPQEGQSSQEASPTFLSRADGGRPFGGSSQVQRWVSFPGNAIVFGGTDQFSCDGTMETSLPSSLRPSQNSRIAPNVPITGVLKAGPVLQSLSSSLIHGGRFGGCRL